MSEIYFPATGQRVVPLLKINDNEDVTFVHARKPESSSPAPKVRILRIVIGSLFRATFVNIESDNWVVQTKRE
ncbi:MAG: hypothetical protein ACR2H4_19690 [Pyrinomonadaceae bacterium]